MRKFWMRKMKKNNGFTLVELLIAVAILTFGIVPLVANFVQSGKMNQKAKINMNATNMAEDIMEGISAYSATDIIKMFESEDDLMGKILANNFSGYRTHGSCDSSWTPVYTATRGSFDNTTNSIGNRQYTDEVLAGNSISVKKPTYHPDDSYLPYQNYTETTNGNYYFYVTDLKQGKNTYDLRLRLSTNYYAKDNPKGGTKTLEQKETLPGQVFPESDHSVNGEKLASIVQMTAPYDCSFRVGSDDFDDMLLEFEKYSNNPSRVVADGDNWKGHLKRIFTIEIKDDDTTGTNPQYRVALYCDYVIDDTLYTRYEIDSVRHPSKVFRTITKDNLSSLPSSSLPRSLYLFYEGLPHSDSYLKCDNFEITNYTEQPFDVYVIRTIPSVGAMYSDTSVQTRTDVDTQLAAGSNVSYNRNYVANFDVAMVDMGANQEYTRLITNVNFDLSRQYDTALEPDQQPGFLNSRANVSFCRFDRLTGAKTYVYGYWNRLFFNGYSLERKDYVYTAYLEVYEHRKGILKKVATFDGGLME